MEIISKKEAIEKKLVKFYTGIPCKNNHLDFRYTNTGICYQCKRNRNKECNKRNLQSSRKRYKNFYYRNKEKCLQKSKFWVANNLNKVKEIKKKNKLKHKIKYKINESLRNKQRRKNDPIWRLNKNISKEIWAFLKDKKQTKSKSWKEYIDFSLEDLKIHLEGLFSDEMNWDNYGILWEIDHIKPLFYFKGLSVTEAVTEAWKLENLQPLEKYLNRSKQHYYVATRSEMIYNIKERQILES